MSATTPVLTLHDTCDRCGAPALVAVLIAIDSEPLRFCGHHYRAAEAVLDTVALATTDHRPVESLAIP